MASEIKPAPKLGANCGSLLRLFQSEFFDAYLHMHYLFRMEQPGVQDYLVNELYQMQDDDIDFYLPQLCQMALLRWDTSPLHSFLLDKAAQSMHFALKIHFLVQSVVEDRTPELREPAMRMWQESEMVVVNSSAPLSGNPGRKQSDLGKSSSDPDLRSREPKSEAPLRHVSPPPSQPASKSNSPRGSTCHSNGNTPLASPAAGNAGARPEALVLNLEGIGEAQESSDSPSPDKGTMSSSTSGADASRQRQTCSDLKDASSPEKGGYAPQAAPAPTSPSAVGRRAECRVEALRQLASLSKQASILEKQQSQALSQLTAMLPACIPSVFNELGESVPFAEGSEDCGAEMWHFLQKQQRCDFFNTQNHFCSLIIKLSNVLVGLEKAHRSACLQKTFEMVNRWLFERLCYVVLNGNNETSFCLKGVHLPILNNRDTRPQVLRVHISDCKIFSSRSRAPFLLVYECADLEEIEGSKDANSKDASSKDAASSNTNGSTSGASGGFRAIMNSLHVCLLEELQRSGMAFLAPTGPAPVSSTSDTGQMSHSAKLCEALKKPTPEAWLQRSATLKEPAQVLRPRTPNRCKHWSRCQLCRNKAEADIEDGSTSGTSDSSSQTRPAASQSSEQCPLLLRQRQALEKRFSIWGETWNRQTARIRSQSSFGHLRSWKLHGVIVKGGDDVRQEMLASQLIGQFAHIFKEAKLPLWLKPIDVLVTSSDSGLIEYVPDSISVDTLKKRLPNVTLADIFVQAFADNQDRKSVV